MEKKLHFERILIASAESTWKLLRQLDGVQNWIPTITSCRVEGEGVGARRLCAVADGGKGGE